MGSNPTATALVMSRDTVDGCVGTSLHFQVFFGGPCIPDDRRSGTRSGRRPPATPQNAALVVIDYQPPPLKT